MRNITSTKLKQSAKEIIDRVVETEEPVVVYTYNQPRVMILKYDKTLLRKKPTIDELKKYMMRIKKKTDFASYFRKMRDEE